MMISRVSLTRFVHLETSGSMISHINGNNPYIYIWSFIHPFISHSYDDHFIHPYEWDFILSLGNGNGQKAILWGACMATSLSKAQKGSSNTTRGTCLGHRVDIRTAGATNFFSLWGPGSKMSEPYEITRFLGKLRKESETIASSSSDP